MTDWHPTPRLRWFKRTFPKEIVVAGEESVWVEGTWEVLQQEWERLNFSSDPEVAFSVESREWRDVPLEEE